MLAFPLAVSAFICVAPSNKVSVVVLRCVQLFLLSVPAVRVRCNPFKMLYQPAHKAILVIPLTQPRNPLLSRANLPATLVPAPRTPSYAMPSHRSRATLPAHHTPAQASHLFSNRRCPSTSYAYRMVRIARRAQRYCENTECHAHTHSGVMVGVARNSEGPQPARKVNSVLAPVARKRQRGHKCAGTRLWWPRAKTKQSQKQGKGRKRKNLRRHARAVPLAL